MTTKKQEQIKYIINQINNSDNNLLMDINNIFCDYQNYSDSNIYNNDDDFLKKFFENNIKEFARACHYGDYNYAHDFVIFNGYGNLESLNNLTTDNLTDNLAGTVENIAEFIYENQELFNHIIEIEND